MKQSGFRRRRFLAGVGALSAPGIVRADNHRTLKFVPRPDLTILDPIVSGPRSTRTHAQMVFDTLYGVDENFVAWPQMVEGHTVEQDGTVWTLRLRDGLRFHDGTPVLGRDIIASIRRFSARDGYAASLMAVTAELSAPDDRTVRFRLSRPFINLPDALGGAGGYPAIMPERLASTDPFRPLTEMVGSGPFRFLAPEFNAGQHVAYERFADYRPRGDGKTSMLSGPKVVHFDRVEFISIGDPATAVGALLRGEVDWLEAPDTDQLPLLEKNPGITVKVYDTAGSIAFARFNQLHPPFNNPAARRALIGAFDQAETMTAVAGADRRYWHDRVGLFGPGSPLANDAGVAIMDPPHDYEKVKRDLAAAGYNGEKITVLAVAGNSFLPMIGQVGADVLRRAGLNMDLVLMDAATQTRRILNKAPPGQGGWHVAFFIMDCQMTANPGTNFFMRGNGEKAGPGWPSSPDIEATRDAWLDADKPDARMRIARDLQQLLWRDVPYIPMGHWVRYAAHRANLADIQKGFATFYGVRRA
jgi:peptide/nickel transport system substrate-binding protein